MFDALLKSKFYSKCKTDIKLTKTRIEMIKRKRNAVQKYLRNDIVDLLKNGLDYNAYGRAEGLLVELNLSSCYDIVEQACACISSHLSAMNKQRECPEECREAVPSLMFAAARFADLPELRALRSLFAEKYGNSLESYVNQELVKKSKSTPPTKVMKLQLLQDIALEHGIEWDSKALEQKLYKPPAPAQDLSKNANEDNSNDLPKRSNPNAWRTVDQKVEDEHRNLRDDIVIERNQEHGHPHGRKAVPSDDNNGSLSCKTPENIPSEATQVVNSDLPGLEKNKGASEVVEDRSQFGYRSIPPPYTKPKVSKNKSSLDASSTSPGREEPTGRKQSDHLDRAEENHQQDETVDKPKPVPKSVRRRKANTSVKKQDGDGGKDEEERLMDKLLMRYSTKPSPKEPGQLEESTSMKLKRRDGVPTRTNSLPGEATTSKSQETKGHARANSFQHENEMLGPPGHMRPKLLDYDDFMARLAALRGKGKE